MARRKIAMCILLHFLVLQKKTSAFRSIRFKDILNQDPSREKMEIKADSDVVVEFLTQEVDHFDPSWSEKINATLKQRFFYSDRYAVKPDGKLPTYAFLCCGGEGPALDESVLIDSVHCSGDMLELAKHLDGKASVHLYALEHRYYGESYPQFSDSDGSSIPALATDNLRYLSSKQALADLAHFVQTRQLPERTKWVTFGGSYPGYVSAMARQVYPNLIHAAVSSSTPLNLMVDFVGYKERQAWDLQYAEIGGRTDCLKIVMDGHAELPARIADDYEGVAQLFHLCDSSELLDENNFGIFLGDGVVDIPAQGNDPSCDFDDVCNLDKMCDFLIESYLDSGSAVVALGALANKQGDSTCSTYDWNATLDYFSDTTIRSDHYRSWLWQTCTEVGFYQTCEVDSLCPFGRGYHTLDADYEICQVAYNLSARQVQANVETTKAHYGDLRERATRVISVNGDVDPWSVLALLESNDPLLPAHVVKGASHHFWTHPVKSTDNQEIKDARDMIHLKVLEWLEQPKDFQDREIATE